MTLGKCKVLGFLLLLNCLKNLGQREPTAMPVFFQFLFLSLHSVALKDHAVAVKTIISAKSVPEENKK